MATAVMRDAAISMRGKKYHLVFPCVGAQWPAMAENNRLSFAPILVVNLCTVFGRDHCHKASPYLAMNVWPVTIQTFNDTPIFELTKARSPACGSSQKEVRRGTLKISIRNQLYLLAGKRFFRRFGSQRGQLNLP